MTPTFKDLVTVGPHPFQLSGAKFAWLHHYCIIADDMGLGKTLQALMVALASGHKTLVVCPAFLRLNWYFEIEKFTRMFYDVCLIEKKVEFEEWRANRDIAIISYSMVPEAGELFEWAECIIADEAHYLKNLEATRTQLFHKHVYENYPKRLMLLTGTPLPNNLSEMYSPLRLMGYGMKRTNGKSIFADYPTPEFFCRDFCIETEVRVGRRTYSKFDGHKNLKLLQEYLVGKYIRREAHEVLDLPPLFHKEVVVAYENNVDLMKEYEAFNEDDNYSAPAKAKSALIKTPFTIDYAQNLLDQEEGPLIIYTDHVDSCLALAEKLDMPHIKGGVPLRKRDRHQKDFSAGRVKGLVITLGAGAEGLNLVEGNHLIFNDENWCPAVNDQATKRFHRIGQEKRCTAHHILGSVQDRRIHGNLKKKRKNIKEVYNVFREATKHTY